MKSKKRTNNYVGKSGRKVIESPQTKLKLCFTKDYTSVYLDPPAVPSPDAASLPKQSLCSSEKNLKSLCKIETDIKEPESVEKKCEKISGDGFHVITIANQSQVKDCIVKNNIDTMKGPTLQKRKKQSNKKKENEVKSHQLTEYFPVRRSNRKTIFNLHQEKQKTIEEAILLGREDGFEIKEFPGKGRGIVTTKNIKRGDFVLEYYGELIDMEEAKVRERLYSAKESTGCYMYYFKHQGKQYCVDATKESGRLGRLVNHSKKGNLKTETFFSKDSPHLILLASKDIAAGEELLYDYGDRSKMSLECYPWLAL